VHFTALSGKTDQAAGLIFRVIDQSNYYILRANALENNVNLYRYRDGARDPIGEGQGTISPGAWYELRGEATGDKLTGYLDGKEVVTAVDGTFGTGRVGLWTKSDPVSCFDDATVRVG